MPHLQSQVATVYSWLPGLPAGARGRLPSDHRMPAMRRSRCGGQKVAGSLARYGQQARVKEARRGSRIEESSGVEPQPLDPSR